MGILVDMTFHGQSYKVPFGWGRKALEVYHYMHDSTNRQLLRWMRDTDKELDELIQMERNGSKYYLGESILKCISSRRTDLKVAKWMVDTRYKAGLISTNK